MLYPRNISDLLLATSATILKRKEMQKENRVGSHQMHGRAPRRMRLHQQLRRSLSKAPDLIFHSLPHYRIGNVVQLHAALVRKVIEHVGSSNCFRSWKSEWFISELWEVNRRRVRTICVVDRGRHARQMCRVLQDVTPKCANTHLNV